MTISDAAPAPTSGIITKTERVVQRYIDTGLQFGRDIVGVCDGMQTMWSWSPELKKPNHLCKPQPSLRAHRAENR